MVVVFYEFLLLLFLLLSSGFDIEIDFKLSDLENSFKIRLKRIVSRLRIEVDSSKGRVKNFSKRKG